jgi:hypothetical protein
MGDFLAILVMTVSANMSFGTGPLSVSVPSQPMPMQVCETIAIQKTADAMAEKNSIGEAHFRCDYIPAIAVLGAKPSTNESSK